MAQSTLLRNGTIKAAQKYADYLGVEVLSVLRMAEDWAREDGRDSIGPEDIAYIKKIMAL